MNKEQLRLYAITDRHWLGEKTLVEQVEEAILGGATCIQLREKELVGADLMEEALCVQSICRRHRVPFIINDSVELALALDADGVHLGQKDMALSDARAILGPDKIIGVSAKTVEQAKAAEAAGASYLGTGAVFQTGSKADASEISHEVLRAICSAVSIPVVAIGGITEGNVLQLRGSGIAGIAVISAVFAQPDVRAAAARLRRQSERTVAPAPKGIIFDMDGTLLDTMPMWMKAGARYLATLGVQAEETLEAVLFSRSTREGATYMKEHYALPLSVEEIMQGFNDTIFSYYRDEAKAKPGVAALLQHFYEAGIPMAVATATDRQHVDAVFARLGFTHYFRAIFTCTALGVNKDVPDIYSEAAKALGTQPEETWVFEDARHAATTAKRAGFYTIGIYDEVSRYNADDLRRLCDWYIEPEEEQAGKWALPVAIL